MAFRALSFILLSTCLTVGCSDNKGKAPPVTGKDILTEIGSMYQAYTKDHRKPPRRLSDFDHPYEPAAINGYAALRSGDYVFLWGGSLPGANASQTVLAYPKAAPTEGGEVLFQDGSIRGVSAEEFKAAPKVSNTAN